MTPEERASKIVYDSWGKTEYENLGIVVASRCSSQAMARKAALTAVEENRINEDGNGKKPGLARSLASVRACSDHGSDGRIILGFAASHVKNTSRQFS